MIFLLVMINLEMLNIIPSPLKIKIYYIYNLFNFKDCNPANHVLQRIRIFQHVQLYTLS